MQTIEIPISDITPLIVLHYQQHVKDLHQQRQVEAKWTGILSGRTSLMFSGPSGAGKSESVFQAFDILKPHFGGDTFNMLDFRPAAHESIDLSGMPAPDFEAEIVKWLQTELLPREGGGILFVDEITSAPKPMQAVLYRLLLTPEDFGIPPEWFLVCAGNRAEDRGVNIPLAGPLVARTRWYDVMPTLGGDGTSNGFLEHAVAAGVRPEVLSFLKDRPDFLYKFEPKGAIRPFPNPRSWSRVSSGLSMEIPERLRMATFAGDVGHEAAVAFEAHMRVYGEMPRIDDILEGKEVEVPKKLNVLYCCSMGLATRVDKDNFANAWKFLSKCPGDIQTLTVKLSYKRDKSIAKSPAYAKWAMENQDAFAA